MSTTKQSISIEGINEIIEDIDPVCSTFAQYKFNAHHVCLNPDTVFELNNNKIYCSIGVAACKKGFISRYDFRIKGSVTGCGSSSGPASSKGPYFNTKEDAIIYECNHALDFFKRKEGLVPAKILQPLNDFILTVKEPTDGEFLQRLFSKPNQSSKKIKMATLQMVKLTDIEPSQTNTLHREPFELEAAALTELTASIKRDGVIQPVLVRPNGKPGKYFLVCGERRYKASEFAGNKDIPVFIRDLTEEQAFDLQIVENLQRKDVHPMKEAQAYKALMDANPEKNTVAELANRFGKSAEYIAQRLSFNSLLPELKKEFIAGKMLIGHAIAFARLQEADQRECMVKCKIKYGPSEGHFEPLNTVQAFINQNIIRELNKAAFIPNDATLIPSAGSCSDCTKRSGTNLLFADVKDKDRCFDGTCFAAKTSLHLINKLAGLKEDNPTLAIIGGHGNHVDSTVKKYLAKNSLRLLKEHVDYRDAAKSDKGSIKALVVAGKDIGEITYIKLVKKEDESGGVTAAKGQVAKNSPAHIDEQIAQVKQSIADSKEEMEANIQKAIVARAVDLKHYNDVSNIALDKYEWAIVLMDIVESNLSGQEMKKVTAWIKKVPVPADIPKAEQLPYQFAHAPQDVITYIFRSYIRMTNIESAVDNQGIAFRKAAEGWKGVNIENIVSDQQAIFNTHKATLDTRIAELQAKKKEMTVVKKPTEKK